MSDRNGSVMRRLLIPLAFVTMGLAAAACLEDDVRYGPPGGLRIRGANQTGDEGACPLPADIDPVACPDWSTQIFPMFDATGKFGCALDFCHGVPPGGASLYMPPGDPATSYDNMAAYAPFGRPYIGPDAQDTAYLICNLSSDPDVNLGTAVMPKIVAGVEGLPLGDDLKMIAEWVNCGMPKGASGGVGGGGAAGGAGGAGGVGGQ